MSCPTFVLLSLSDLVRQGLDEYRGFRHIVRNVYAYKFDLVRIERLMQKIAPLFRQLQAELSAFADFLEFHDEDS